jgi:hypothetical protein
MSGEGSDLEGGTISYDAKESQGAPNGLEFERYNDAERAADDLFASWMQAQRTAERGAEANLPLCRADVTDSTRLTGSTRGHPTGENALGNALFGARLAAIG